MTSSDKDCAPTNRGTVGKRRLSILVDTVITEKQNRPQRNFDGFVSTDSIGIEYLTLFRAEDDQSLEQKIKFLNTFAKRIVFFRYASLLNIARHFWKLLRSEWVFCAPHYFWGLVMLNRVGLFPVGGKTISCQFTRHDSFTRRLPALAKAPQEFRAYYTGRDQIKVLEERGAPIGRLKFIEWRIDAKWFRPLEAPSRDYILCPGNVHRNEQLVMELARSTPLKVIRVGQIGILQQLYAEHVGPNLELHLNVDHVEYLRLLQNAAVVILPINPCDEPAGITAALEAVSCAVPVLANDSFGVTPLLQAAYGKEPVSSLDAAVWLEAIQATLNGQLFSASVLAEGREHILKRRALPPEGEDWHFIFD